MGNSESKKDKNTIIRHSLVGTSNGQNDIRKIIKKKKKNKNWKRVMLYRFTRPYRNHSPIT